MNIINTIKDLRGKRGLTQAQLAEAAGLSTTYISQLESGLKSPTLKSLEKISQALEVPFPILSFLSLGPEDVAPAKRDAFEFIRPSVLKMVEEFFVGE